MIVRGEEGEDVVSRAGDRVDGGGERVKMKRKIGGGGGGKKWGGKKFTGSREDAAGEDALS